MKLGAVSTALGLIGALCLLAAFTPGLAQRPASDIRVELGRRLFYDADLSIDGTMACATCHEQRHGFADGNATHPGVHGDPGRRNVMTLANVGGFSSLTWGDPRVTRLEDQALIPITGTAPIEMGFHGREKVLEDRIGGQACYRKLFAAAFPETGGEVSMATIARALAAFERTLISRDAPYDRWKRGEAVDIPLDAQRGERLFLGKARCASCHAGPDFTDATKAAPEAAFHAIDLPFSGDQGLFEITGQPSDKARFRTPSLRNVAVSAPYLHDGSARTLTWAIRRHRVAVGLTETEIKDLVAFLETLTDARFLTDPRLALPKTSCEADTRGL